MGQSLCFVGIFSLDQLGDSLSGYDKSGPRLGGPVVQMLMKAVCQVHISKRRHDPEVH